MKEDLEALESLSEHLVFNYIKGSLKEEYDSNTELSYIDEILTNPDVKDSLKIKERIILVTGAGLTFNAFTNIPLGDVAIEEIQKSFKISGISFYDLINKKGKENPQLLKKYGDELKKMRLYGNENTLSANQKDDFETSLNVLSHFFHIDDIRDEISRLYKFRFGSTFYYDLISHFFKHRFFDVIVNFNFDELLDQSIEDELGRNTYIKIISDGDCKPIKDILISDRMKQPIYIKPHGTFSHKSSLRFTKNQYEDLPNDMKKLLTEIVTGKTSIENKIKNPIIIVMGFAMGSLEFDEMINSIEGEPQIYFFHFNNKHDLKKKYPKLEGKIHYINVKILECPFLEDSTEYDKALYILWEKVTNKFKKLFEPDGINRHLLLRQCFQMQSFLNDPTRGGINVEYLEKSKYFSDRAIIEVFMALSKAKRSVSLKSLINSKAGYYYSKFYYSEVIEKRVGFIKFLEKLNVIYDLDTESVRPKNPKMLNNLQSILDIDYMFSATLKSKIKNWVNINNQKLWTDYISNSSSIVAPNFDHYGFTSFDKYDKSQLLHTKFSLKYELLKRFKKREWTKILIIEDHADRFELFKDFFKNVKEVYPIFSFDPKWIENFYKKNEEEKFSLLIEDGFRAKLKEKNLIENTRFLPEYKHEHHMTIFVFDDGKNCYIDCLYYKKNAYTNKITPVEITELDNVKQLLNIFIKYYYDTEIIKSPQKSNITESVSIFNPKHLLADYVKRGKKIID